MIHLSFEFRVVTVRLYPPPQLGARAAYFKQAIHDRLIEHRQYIEKHGDDMPAIRGWKWGAKAPAGAARTSTEGDNL